MDAHRDGAFPILHDRPAQRGPLTHTSRYDILLRDTEWNSFHSKRLCGKQNGVSMSDQHDPLTPALFHVLMALADGDKHGYGIMKEVDRQTSGDVQLSTGTLYGIIKRLLSTGWIKEVAGPSKNDDPRRRYYRLTEEGRDMAVAEARRLEKLVERARSKRLIRRYGNA